MNRSSGVWIVLVLAGWSLPAAAQVYCSRWAAVVDAPTNVRRAPNGQAAIACRLPRNGLRLLVIPLRPQASGQASPWLATTVCRSGAQRAAIGLGLAPDYIHRSQLRLLEANPDDWLEDPTGQGRGPCAALWDQPPPQP